MLAALAASRLDVRPLPTPGVVAAFPATLANLELGPVWRSPDNSQEVYSLVRLLLDMKRDSRLRALGRVRGPGTRWGQEARAEHALVLQEAA